MSDTTQPARVRPSKTLISTVWLIPLVAALVGAYLLVKTLNESHNEITLLMENADGIEVNTTTIRVLNVEVGRVNKVLLNETGNGVKITAKLNRESMALMRKDTQFWVVKPRIDQNGVTGLSTLLSGSYISFAPGNSSETAREFKVAELPPISALGQSGIRLSLKGSNSKMVSVGSPVLFESHIVGSVESAKFNPTDKSVHYSVFIHSPNENLLNGASRFWLSSGVDMRLNGNNINITTPPISALITGAISFDSPQYRPQSKQSVQNGAEFTVYNNRSEIENQPSERTLYYMAFFNSSVRGLESGAPVMYKGIQIGSVADVAYFEQGDQARLFQNQWIPVRLRIEPFLIEGINAEQRQSKETWQNIIQAALNRGLTASLGTHQLVLGSKLIELNDGQGGYKPRTQYHGYTVIATNDTGLDQLQNQVGKLLEKINKLPVDKTLAELNGSLKQLQKLLSSTQHLVGQSSTQNLPKELNQTMQTLQKTLQGISPQSPVYQDAQQTLQDLDRTLKNAQPLLDKLNARPNALIFQQGSSDPTPKGK